MSLNAIRENKILAKISGFTVVKLYGTTVQPNRKKQLEASHTEAARIVSGAPKLCSIDKLLMNLGWGSLQSRRSTHKLLLFYKILHDIAPNFLSELVPSLVQETTTYRFRNSDNI